MKFFKHKTKKDNGETNNVKNDIKDNVRELKKEVVKKETSPYAPKTLKGQGQEIKKDDKKAENKEVKKSKNVEDNFSLKDSSAKQILIRVIATEKSVGEEKIGKYVFEVDSCANKITVKQAIKNAYGVNPVKVNILNKRRKNVRFGRMSGFRKGWKKAVVTLKKGESIMVYSPKAENK